MENHVLEASSEVIQQQHHPIHPQQQQNVVVHQQLQNQQLNLQVQVTPHQGPQQVKFVRVHWPPMIMNQHGPQGHQSSQVGQHYQMPPQLAINYQGQFGPGQQVRILRPGQQIRIVAQRATPQLGTNRLGTFFWVLEFLVQTY